jgi:hypothetical protein
MELKDMGVLVAVLEKGEYMNPFNGIESSIYYLG